MKISKNIFSAILMSLMLPVLNSADNLIGVPVVPDPPPPGPPTYYCTVTVNGMDNFIAGQNKLIAGQVYQFEAVVSPPSVVDQSGIYEWQIPQGFTVAPEVNGTGSMQTNKSYIRLKAPNNATSGVISVGYYADADHTFPEGYSAMSKTLYGISVYNANVKVIKVPEYLFLSANYWTTVRFEVCTQIGDIEADDIKSLTLTLHYGKDGSSWEGELEISGLENAVARLDEETTAGRYVFECYINPSVFKNDADLMEFLLDEDLVAKDNAIELSATIEKPSGHTFVVSHSEYADQPYIEYLVHQNVFAVDSVTSRDMGDFVERDDNDPANPFRFSDAKSRWHLVDPGSWYGTPIEEDGWTDPTDPSLPNKPYWDRHKPLISFVQPNYPWAAGYSDCLNGTPASSGYPNGLTLDSSADFSATYCGNNALWATANAVQKDGEKDMGLYRGNTFGLRYGAYMCISYGGKIPRKPDNTKLLPDSVTVMDLEKDESFGYLTGPEGRAKTDCTAPVVGDNSDASLTDIFVRGGASTAVTISSFFGAPGAVVAVGFILAETGYEYYRHGAKDPSQSSVQYADAWVSSYFSYVKFDEINEQPESSLDPDSPLHSYGFVRGAYGGQTQFSPSDLTFCADFNIYKKEVGTVVCAFLELNSTIQIEAKDENTGCYSAAYWYPIDSNEEDKFYYCVYCY